jgi:hypothetical protein
VRGVGDLADLVDDAAVGRHVHQGDKSDALVEHAGERLGGEHAGAVRRDDLHRRADRLGPHQQRDGVAAVLDLADENAVPGRQRNRVERRQPASGGAVGERDLIRSAAEELAEDPVSGVQVVAALGGRAVSPDLRLPLQVPDHLVEHLSGHQG